MTVEKPKPKQLLRPITTGANSAMNQSEFLLITSNSLKGREKSRVHGAIGFGFASHWLKNWRESFKPITKRSNRNHVITFDSHLKTALSEWIRSRLSTTHNFPCLKVTYSLTCTLIFVVLQLYRMLKECHLKNTFYRMSYSTLTNLQIAQKLWN